MAKDCLKYYLPEWTFQFDGAKKRFGYCSYRRKEITVSLEMAIKNEEDQVLDVILHEIAHGIAGHKAGHGFEWKRVCVDIGADPNQYYDSSTVQQADHRYEAMCSCNRPHKRHQKPWRGRTYYCRTCHEQLSFYKV